MTTEKPEAVASKHQGGISRHGMLSIRHEYEAASSLGSHYGATDEAIGDLEESLDEIERWQSSVFRLTDEKRLAVRKGMEAAERGDCVADEELAAFYRRHGG